MCGHLMPLPEVCKSLCSLSLCDPGVHASLYIILDDPLTDGDKAEMEAIKSILSSRINQHAVVLISRNSEQRTAELHKYVFESFQRQHNSCRHTKKVSTLVGRFEQMTEESRDDYLCTETFLEVQVEGLLQSRSEKIQSQGNDKNLRIYLKHALYIKTTGTNLDCPKKPTAALRNNVVSQ